MRGQSDSPWQLDVGFTGVDVRVDPVPVLHHLGRGKEMLCGDAVRPPECQPTILGRPVVVESCSRRIVGATFAEIQIQRSEAGSFME
jgi:hypothetical protein